MRPSHTLTLAAAITALTSVMATANAQSELVAERQPLFQDSIIPCGTWERVSSPNPGSIRNAFIDADEGPDGAYALLRFDSTPSTSDPDEFKVLRLSGDAQEDLGAPSGNGGLTLLEYRTIAVAPDGTVWLGAEWFPEAQLGQNPAPAIAWRTPDGTWHGPEEIPVEPNTDEPPSRRFVEHESLEIAPDGTVFYMGDIRNFSSLFTDRVTPMVIANDGNGWVEVGADDRVDDVNWPGGDFSAFNYAQDAIAFQSDNLWMVGSHGTKVQAGTGAFIGRYTGTTPIEVVEEGEQEPRTDPYAAAELEAMDANGPNDIWAVGSSGEAGSPLSLIVHWDGAAWTRFRSPPELNPANIVLADDGTAWAVNTFAERKAAYFDGSRWREADFLPASEAGTVNIQSMVEAPDGTLWALGFNFDTNETYARRLLCTAQSCPGDVNRDGVVGFSDLIEILGLFGTQNPEADVDQNGTVGFSDLVATLGLFGPCDSQPVPGFACPGQGDCSIANGTPGCEDAECCEAVAAVDSFSGLVEWDWLSAELAGEIAACGFPSGDDCANAVPVGEGRFVSSTTYKSIGPDVSSGGFDDVIDEWWAFTPPCDGPVVVSMLFDNNPQIDATIAVFDSCNGNEIAFADNTSFFLPEVTFEAQADQTYLVRVAMEFGDWANYTIDFSCEVDPITGGDDCASAAPITEGSFPATTSDNAGLELFSSDCVVISNQIDEWFSFTATSDGTLTVSTCSGPAAGPDTLIDPNLTIFDECNGTQLACNNDAFCQPNARNAEISLNVTEGQTYLIRVGGSFPNQGDYQIDVTLTP